MRLDSNGNTKFFKGGSTLTINVASNTAPSNIQGSAALYVRRCVNADNVTRISSETARTSSDDPAAYQTVYNIDDKATVEQQQYIGETETLLEIIRDLGNVTTEGA